MSTTPNSPQARYGRLVTGTDAAQDWFEPVRIIERPMLTPEQEDEWF